MQKDVNNIRNFVLAGHSHGGKTALSDLMLFKAKAVDKLGSVNNDTSVSDYTPEEKAKKSSIFSTPMNCEWNSNDLFFTDTPGYGEFIGEVVSSIAATDGVLIVIDGANGIEIGATRARKLAVKMNVPCMFFINKLDCDNTDFDKVLTQLQDAYGKTVCVPMTLPIGKTADFSKIVHMLKNNDIPDDLTDDVAKYKEMIMDTVAESNEELMERYLEGEELSEEEISKGLHKAVRNGDIIPVFAGSVEKDIGVTELMNGVVNLFPKPLNSENNIINSGDIVKSVDGDGTAMVFKTIIDPFVGQLNIIRVISGKFSSDSEIYNVSTSTKERVASLMVVNGKTQEKVAAVLPGGVCAIAKLKDTHTQNTLSTSLKSTIQVDAIPYTKPVMFCAVTAVKSGDEDKIAQGLNKISGIDPTITFGREKETHEMLLGGKGDLHIQNAVKKLKEIANVDVELNAPKIPYRETITTTGSAHYRHKKQSGGSGQFGEVHIRIEPNKEGYEFANEVVGGNIPKNFIPAVEKGIVEAMVKGPLAGCTVENIKVAVYDGKHHPVDSNEMAFKIAARTAFRQAIQNSKPILLEPIMSIAVTFPDEYTGDINGDLNQKRGRIMGMEVDDGLQVIKAEAPLSEMSKYATELRSMTQGRGVFEMEFNRYDMVPGNVTKEIIKNFQKDNAE